MKNSEAESYVLGMGGDSATAAALAIKLSAEDIMAKSPAELQELGLKSSVVDAISKKRPPIPEKILREVLDKNMFLCCVCKNRTQNVVVHHIYRYAESKNHAISNLAVLCQTHHSDAHSTHGLVQNLTPDKIAECKRNWEKETPNIKQWIVGSQSRRNKACRWDWVNYPRLLETFASLKLKGTAGEAFDTLRQNGIVDPAGQFIGSSWQHVKLVDNDYFIKGKQQLEIAGYIGQMLELIAKSVPVIDVTNWLHNCPAVVSKFVKEGDFISVKAPFVYQKAFSDQMSATASDASASITFPFDPFYCLSSTSRFNYYDVTPVHQVLFGTVRSICLVGDRLSIRVSALGTSPTFSPYSLLQGDWVRGTEPEVQ